eukprot:TRINITY_DN26203_c0_g2_i2.p1 TRINITY_DN26203_c0_g2~~TRINITY_DN26203_c0_g2_i2.p1  ORF type:complete len:389 (+),score=-39.24 TRINITY_DN26203_c0_g2_i2:564-1730(+)
MIQFLIFTINIVLLVFIFLYCINLYCQKMLAYTGQLQLIYNIHTLQNLVKIQSKKVNQPSNTTTIDNQTQLKQYSQPTIIKMPPQKIKIEIRKGLRRKKNTPTYLNLSLLKLNHRTNALSCRKLNHRYVIIVQKMHQKITTQFSNQKIPLNQILIQAVKSFQVFVRIFVPWICTICSIQIQIILWLLFYWIQKVQKCKIYKNYFFKISYFFCINFNQARIQFGGIKCFLNCKLEKIFILPRCQFKQNQNHCYYFLYIKGQIWRINIVHSEPQLFIQLRKMLQVKQILQELIKFLHKIMKSYYLVYCSKNYKSYKSTPTQIVCCIAFMPIISENYHNILYFCRRFCNAKNVRILDRPFCISNFALGIHDCSVVFYYLTKKKHSYLVLLD